MSKDHPPQQVFKICRNEEGKTLLTDPYVVEASLDKTATFLQSGSSSGTAYILKGMDVAAS